jgi:hypothetical protein
MEAGVADCVWLGIPKSAKWQRVRNQIDTALIFARSDFVKVLQLVRCSSHLCGLAYVPGTRVLCSLLVALADEMPRRET